MEKNLTDELNEISDGRLKKTKHEPPAGYFNSFPDHVINKWNSQLGGEEKGIVKLRKMIAAAAVVTGICFTIALSSNGLLNNGLHTDISASEAYDYIIEHIDEFETLIDAPVEFADQSNFQILESSEIEDYLLEEMDDTEIELIF